MSHEQLMIWSLDQLISVHIWPRISGTINHFFVLNYLILLGSIEFITYRLKSGLRMDVVNLGAERFEPSSSYNPCFGIVKAFWRYRIKIKHVPNLNFVILASSRLTPFSATTSRHLPRGRSPQYFIRISYPYLEWDNEQNDWKYEIRSWTETKGQSIKPVSASSSRGRLWRSIDS